jgi:uncharacterized membrane protein
MSVRVSKSIKINAPVEQAFDYIADWRNATRVQVNFSSFRPIDANALGPGVVIAIKGRFHGLPITVRMKITEFESPRRMVGQVSGMLKSVNAWLFEPLEDGCTKVTFVNEYHVPAPLMLLLGRNSIVDREVTQMTEDALRRLKRLVENGSDE